MSATPTVSTIVTDTTKDSTQVLFAKTKEGFFQDAWREEENGKFHTRYFPSGRARYSFIEVVSERHESEDPEDSDAPTVVIFSYPHLDPFGPNPPVDTFIVKYAKVKDGFFQMALSQTAEGKFVIRYYPSGDAGYQYIEVVSEKRTGEKKYEKPRNRY